MPNNNNVFINCPFDDEYAQFMRCIIFVVVSLGYNPRISTESSNGGTVRLNKIIKLIEESRISIHDISRMKAAEKDEFFRMNMPFELGLDFGCLNYSGDELHKKKKYLIVGEKEYEYMKSLSDISGIDIEYHNCDIDKIVKVIRHWFKKNDNPPNDMHPKEISNHFYDYNKDFYNYAIDNKYEEDEIFDMPLNEQIDYIKNYYGKL